MGNNFQGIVEPIKVPAKGARYGLGYVPTDNEVNLKKTGAQTLSKPISHLNQSFLVREHANRYGLGEEILSLFEEIDAVIEDEVNLESGC